MFGFLKDVIKSFSKVATDQDVKGLEKYGETLNPSYEMDMQNKTYSKYDWLQMIREEMVDGFKYIEMEEIRRESKRDASDELIAKICEQIDEVLIFSEISEAAYESLKTAKDLLSLLSDINQR